LEYKAKDNYHIEFVSRSGNVFTFRLKHPLNGIAAGKTVRVSASGVTTLAEHKAAPPESGGFFAQAGEFLGNLFSVSTAHADDLYQTYITDRNGEFRVTITGLTASSTVNIQAGEAERTFTAAEFGGGSASGYTYNLSAVTVDGSGVLRGTIKVTNTADGSPAAGVSVSVLYKTDGGSGAVPTAVALPGVTDANGDINVSGTINPTPRKVVLAVRVGASDSSYTSAFTIGTLTPGFLTGPSLNDDDSAQMMTWSEAKTYCSNHGGRLPRIQDEELLYDPKSSNVPKMTYPGGLVDGFGELAIDPWPGAPFPIYSYNDNFATGFWTGTVRGDSSGYSWYVYRGEHINGCVTYGYSEQVYSYRVACVP
ncbi:hypothetical protein LJC09_03990, partial [Desulfovibrio sp. OttesenSCG-928-F20]|nr:hypothetical protein [Desulfovibrio sp. OttesenSCG-928-F20]